MNCTYSWINNYFSNKTNQIINSDTFYRSTFAEIAQITRFIPI